jgi:hypothetical protein
MTARAGGVRRTDNSDEAEAAGRAWAAASAGLTNAEALTLKSALVNAKHFAQSESRVASGNARRLRLDGLLADLAPALEILERQPQPKR